MTSNSDRKFSELATRLVTGIIGAFLMIWLIAISEWGFFCIFLFGTLVTQVEFYQLIIKKGDIPLKTYGAMVGGVLFTLAFFIESGKIQGEWLFLLFPLTSIIYFIKLYKKVEEYPFRNIAFTFLGIIYVALPFSLLGAAAFTLGEYHPQIIIGIFLILWASDTGAYFAGTLFGKNKLFERVSPKKSWEGLLGGAILSLAFAFGISFFFVELVLWKWLVISVLTIVCGTYGDLVESLFKRSMDIKDSGTKLPGHGGFLDRFDGLLLAIPFIVIFLKFFAKY
jgi:phosphatidate cytidylyltransferase